MISDQQLDKLRLDGTLVRVIRDLLEDNDVLGHVVAWNETHVLIRKRNRKVVKLSRNYVYQHADEPRSVEN